MTISKKVPLATLCLILLSSLAFVYAQSNPEVNNGASPTSMNLNSVFIVSNQTVPTNVSLNRQDAWAVGAIGTILHWTGASWNITESPTTNDLYSVLMVNETSGWAVGGTSTEGTILQYNGTWNTWSNVTYQTANETGINNDKINATLYGIAMDANGTSGWIVGANGTILHWSGNEWIGSTNVTQNTLRSVAVIHNVTSMEEAWAVGDNGTILHWDGSVWANYAGSPTSMALRSVVITNSTEGWAVGGDDGEGVILNWTRSGWTIWDNINFGGAVNMTAGYVTDKINATLNSMSMSTGDLAWAVGDNGTVAYWDGIQWSGQTGNVTTANLNGVSMIHGVQEASDNVWAVGDGGVILAWTGTQWVPASSISAIATPLLSLRKSNSANLRLSA